MEGVFLAKGMVDLLASKNGRVAAEIGCALATAYPAYLAAKMALRPALASPAERTRLLKYFALAGAVAAAEPPFRRLPLSAHARLALLLFLQLGPASGGWPASLGAGGRDSSAVADANNNNNNGHATTTTTTTPHNAAAAAVFDARAAPLLSRYSRKLDVVLGAAWRAVAAPMAAAGQALAEAAHEARQLVVWFFEDGGAAAGGVGPGGGGGGGGIGGGGGGAAAADAAAAARKRVRREAGGAASSGDEDEGVLVSRGSPARAGGGGGSGTAGAAARPGAGSPSSSFSWWGGGGGG